MSVLKTQAGETRDPGGRGAAAVLVAAFNPATSSAAPIACGEAALIAAIETANVSAGPDTIELPAGCVYTFTAPYISGSNAYDYWYGPSALPAIASDITIQGNGVDHRT